MGSGRDKRKKANPTKPGVGAAKTERKTAAADEKRKRREDRGGADEDDIDALLARAKLEDGGGAAAVEEGVPPPTKRVNASLTHAAGPRAGELLLYGGEWYDNAKTHVYGELYRFDAPRRRWARVRAAGAPPPRSAHQAAAYKHYLFVFGGEFTSPNQARAAACHLPAPNRALGMRRARFDARACAPTQERFLHYKDLWRLDLTTWQWEQLTLRGGPSARCAACARCGGRRARSLLTRTRLRASSGHRMVVYKAKLLIFGGFYDASKETKYYNDLWELDLETLKWTSLGKPGAIAPPPRSGCQLALHADAGMLYLYGGTHDTADACNCDAHSDARSRAGYRKEAAEDGDERGVVLSDCWALELNSYTWERVKRAGIAPGPRSGFTLAVHRSRAVLFGAHRHIGDVCVSAVFCADVACAQVGWLTTRRKAARF